MWPLSGARVIRNSLVKGSCISRNFNRVNAFHTNSILRNGSIFGQLTNVPKDEPAVQKKQEQDSSVSTATSSTSAESLLPKDDPELTKYHQERALKAQITADKFITPLKRRLFDLNVKENGFFKNDQVVKDPENGKSYKLNLTTKEIEALEPSIYLQSLRIKSSIKKATVVNRFVRGYKVKTAITQLHFNPKKMATELEKLLKQGLDLAREQGFNEDELYINEVWTGSDGATIKRPDIKGRGRTGILQHRYVHLKAILKTEKTLKRLRWEKDEQIASTKPRMHLNNEPLNFRVKSFYKW